MIDVLKNLSEVFRDLGKGAGGGGGLGVGGDCGQRVPFVDHIGYDNTNILPPTPGNK